MTELFDLLDTMLSDWSRLPTRSYPPYDIVKESSTAFRFDIAVAGFSRDDLDIQYENNTLTVSTNKKTDEADYIYRGIARRQFRLSWRLGDNVVVKTADLVDGILRIECELILPDEKKPRKIEIGYNGDTKAIEQTT